MVSIVRSLGEFLARILFVLLLQIQVFAPCMFLFSGIITTWREADYISSLGEEKQAIAFREIADGQKHHGYVALTSDSRYGVGLVRGASTASIMREMFIGSDYAACAYFMASVLLSWLILFTTGIFSAVDKCAK